MNCGESLPAVDESSLHDAQGQAKPAAEVTGSASPGGQAPRPGTQRVLSPAHPAAAKKRDARKIVVGAIVVFLLLLVAAWRINAAIDNAATDAQMEEQRKKEAEKERKQLDDMMKQWRKR